MPVPLALGLAVGAGSVISSALSWWNQRRSERLQTELANSAVQRRVADLRAAGINPILAAQGQGAPVPNVQPVRFENPAEAAVEAYNSAKRVSNESSLVEEQRAKLRADTAVSVQQLENMKAAVRLTVAQVKNTEANTSMTWTKMTQEEFWQQLARIAGNTISRYLGGRKAGQGIDEAFDQLVDEVAKGFGVVRPIDHEKVREIWKSGEVNTGKANPLKGTLRRKGGGSGSW